jgi:hypothetical protein
MKRPFLTLVFYFIGFSTLTAQENHPKGARSLALSHAYVSISDSWSTFHNQAGLAGLNHISTSVFYESKFGIEELSLSAGSLALPLQSGTFGINFSQFGKGTFKENKFGLAFAKKLSDKLHAGIQLDYFSMRFPENSNRFGFATFEAGLIYSPDKKLFLGAHIFNPISNGIKTTFGKQKSPFIFRLGGHFQFSEMLMAIFETQKNTDYPILIKSGLEFSPVNNLALRFGVSGKPINYTCGLGYKFKNISTDFGFAYHGSLGLTPAVSIQFEL